MSSHREAPEISKDPVADNADVYAFVSPDAASTVTLIANFIPMQNPMGGPNFFEFGDDVLYRIAVDNNGDGKPDVTFEFRFTTVVENPDTFLYNTGQITTIDSPSWNRKQFYCVTRVTKTKKGKTRRSRKGGKKGDEVEEAVIADEPKVEKAKVAKAKEEKPEKVKKPAKKEEKKKK